MDREQDTETRVRVEHYRQPLYFRSGHYRRYYRGQGFGGDRIADNLSLAVEGGPKERGGVTRALVTVDGVDFIGRAECSVRDSFSYWIGRHIAVGRLRKQLAPLGYAINADGIVTKDV